MVLHSFCGPETWEQLSWVVLAEGLLRSCSQAVIQNAVCHLKAWLWLEAPVPPSQYCRPLHRDVHKITVNFPQSQHQRERGRQSGWLL